MRRKVSVYAEWVDGVVATLEQVRNNHSTLPSALLDEIGRWIDNPPNTLTAQPEPPLHWEPMDDGAYVFGLTHWIEVSEDGELIDIWDGIDHIQLDLSIRPALRLCRREAAPSDGSAQVVRAACNME